MQTAKFLIIAPLFGPILSIQSQAQEAQSPPVKPLTNVGAPEQVQQVEIVGKGAAETARDETLSRKVISSAELARFGDSSITEAMKRVPGVLVVNNQMQLVGLAANYTQVLINGEPPRGVTVSELPMSSIERVEIYRGGNAQFSSQAIAGTINIVLKKIPSTAQRQFKLAAAKAYGWSKSGDWLGSDKWGKLSYSLAVSGGESGAQSSSPFNSQAESIDAEGRVIQKYSQYIRRDADNKSLRINPRLQYKTEDGTSLNLSSSVGTTRRVATHSERYLFDVGLPLAVAGFEQASRSENNAGNAVLNASKGLENGVKINANLSISGGGSTFRTFQEAYDFRSAPMYERDRRTKSRQNGLDFNGKITVPTSARHDVVAGWAVSDARTRRARYEVQQNSTGGAPLTDVQNTASQVNKLDFFIQDEWNFNKSASLYLGLRSEMVQIRAEESGQSSAKSNSRILSPVVQSLWKLNAENTERVRLGVSRTYSPPTEEQLLAPRWSAINNTIQSPNLQGNPLLRPEVAWSIDSSYEHEGANGFNLTLRAKYSRIEDLIRESLSYSNQLWVLSYINAGAATSKSVDIETQFPLKVLIDTGENINVSLNISKNWSNIEFLPGPENYLSPISLSGSLNIDFQARVLPLGMGISLSGNDAQWQRINLTKREYTRMGADLSGYLLWKFDKKTQVRMGFSNLLKKPFIYQTQYASDGSRTNFSMNTPAYRRVTFNFERKY